LSRFVAFWRFCHVFLACAGKDAKDAKLLTRNARIFWGRFLYQAKAHLLQVVDRAPKTLPFLYQFSICLPLLPILTGYGVFGPQRDFLTLSAVTCGYLKHDF
jgi:hypothetical protein